MASASDSETSTIEIGGEVLQVINGTGIVAMIPFAASVEELEYEALIHLGVGA